MDKPTTLGLAMLLQIATLSLSAQVSYVGAKKLEMNINGSNLKIPYWASSILTGTISNINSAIVVIHGTDRNADDYYYNMQTAAAMRPDESDSCYVFAPQFLTEEDINYHSLDSEHLYWSSGGWKSGSNSKNNASNPRPERIPSYAVLDTILLRLYESCPSLESIIVTGHSAGAQFVNRYAATSPMIDILSGQYGLRIKFLVANPSSYLYFDDRRVVSGTINQFATPGSSCTGYNEWKYGLDNLYTYPSHVGADSIRKMYKRREISYILGSLDNDPSSSTLDVSCEAMLQGHYRLERGSIYFNYLKDYYGISILDYQTIDTVPGVGHSNLGMYTSPVGLCHLFNLGPVPCDCSDPTTVIPILTDEWDMVVYPNPTSGKLSVYMKAGCMTEDMRLEIYSEGGKKVAEVFNNPKIDIGYLPEGIYIIRLISGNYSTARKVILKK